MEAWTFNGTIPGPTFRATEGDLIRINFFNNGSHPHSIHTHGIHKAEMDGVFEIINPGGRFIYEFCAEQVSIFALLGTYVCVIPVLIGLLWYPFIKRLSQNKYNFFLSLTAGLLLFLGIDAIVDANEIVTANLAGAFQGQLLIATAAIVSFLALMYVSERLVDAAKGRVIKGSFAIALMVAIGIGMHNLGEGLAIGGTMVLGEVALSTFLIVGFTLHNTTEGLAIVAPMARERPKIAYLVALGIIAGAPAIAGMG
jgi:zinc transporter ZupT